LIFLSRFFVQKGMGEAFLLSEKLAHVRKVCFEAILLSSAFKMILKMRLSLCEIDREWR